MLDISLPPNTYTGLLQNGAIPMPGSGLPANAAGVQNPIPRPTLPSDSGAGTTIGGAPAQASGASGNFFQGSSLPLVTSAQTTQTTAPSFYLDYLNNLAQKGMNSNPQFAGPSPLQTQGFDLAASTPGAWKPAMNMGMGYLGQVGNYDPTKAAEGALGSALSKDAMGAANPYLNSAANPTYNTVGNYMSPYIGNVVNSIGTLGEQNILQNVAPQTTAGVVGAGQFGSQRGAQALGQTLNQAALGITGQQANALNTGYQQAMQQAQAGANLQGQLGQIAGSLTNAQQQNLGTIGQIQGNLTSQQQQNLINAASTGGNLASQTGALSWNDVTGLLNAGGQQQQLMQAEQMFPLTAGLAQSQMLRGYQIPTSTSMSYTQPGSQNSSGLSPLQSIAGLTGLLASPNWAGAANNIGNLFGRPNISGVDAATNMPGFANSYNTAMNNASWYPGVSADNLGQSQIFDPTSGSNIFSWAGD